MPWYAVEELDEAFEETKDLLLPLEKGKWLRLLVIAFFIGGIGFSFPPIPGGDYEDSSSYGSTDYSAPATAMATAAPALALVTFISLAVFSLVILFLILGKVFEFIFYQSLLDKNVRIRPNLKKHFWKGVQLFGFDIFMLLGLLAVFVLIALIGTGLALNTFLVVLMLIFAGVPAMLLLMLILNITHDFVLLEMIEEQQNIIKSWKSFYPTLADQWRQVGVYIIVKLFVGFLITILSGAFLMTIIFPGLLVFGIPAILLAFLHPVLSLLPIILGFILFVVALLGFKAAVSTYIYYFSILVFHDLKQE